jgi:tetratricopeptide (TPR) repeat protein
MIEEAIKYYREALRLKPDYVKAKENLRMALSQKNIQDTPNEIEKRPNLNDNTSKDE